MSERSKIEASKLARGLGAALERVVGGETIEIIRYGRVVAVLVPPGKREPVRPDTARPVVPQVQKTEPLTQTRQQRIDALLKGSRKTG